MALKIKKGTDTFDLPAGYSIEIEDTSPVYNELGSRSVSATLPASKRNLRLTNHPDRLDIESSPNENPRVGVSDGVYHRIGKMNITQGSKADGIVSNIGFDESEIYNLWKDVPLRSLENFPVYAPDGGVTELLQYIYDILQEKIDHEAFRIFQICVGMPSKKETVDGKEVETFYPEYLNHLYKDSSGFHVDGSARKEVFLINNEPVTTSLPLGYGLTPYLRVGWLIDFIFSQYGYKVTENPFKTHPQLSLLVVLNNAADCIVKGRLNYADLLPECTINEFFQALYCRFGAVYFVDGRTKTVKLNFIKDIIDKPASQDWTLFKAGEPVINYNAAQQLKLSTNTGIAGPDKYLTASPAANSLDSFLAPYNYIVSNSSEGYLSYQKVYGTFSRRNIATNETYAISSDFFPWDRGSNIDYYEISSVDECLPVKGASPDNDYLCPAYLVGKVHRYTMIESSDVEYSADNDKSTPLCFCFSHPYKAYTHPFGSPRCLRPDGKQVVDSAGNVFDISLTFVGEHGLFERFWKGYDAILRHANHTIECEFHLTHNTLLNADFSRPVSLSGQRLLPDTTRYQLPLSKANPSSVQFRTLKLLKPYNLDDEQSIIITEQLYRWVFYTTKAEVVDAATQADIAAYKKGLGPNVWKEALYKDEKEDTISESELPSTLPTADEYHNNEVRFIKQMNYSFTLYYVVLMLTYDKNMWPIYVETEFKGKSYAVKYDAYVKAASI